jgi:hypothetical protein
MKICNEKNALVFSKNHQIAHDVFDTGLFMDVLCGTQLDGNADITDMGIEDMLKAAKISYRQADQLEELFVVFDKHYEPILNRLQKSPVIGAIALCKWDDANKKLIKVGYL